MFITLVPNPWQPISTPPVEGSPLVVYCGPGSDDVVSRQGETGDTGTGLGIVRTIAEAHGREVTATESEVPALDDGRSLRGARFEFRAVRSTDS